MKTQNTRYGTGKNGTAFGKNPYFKEIRGGFVFGFTDAFGGRGVVPIQFHQGANPIHFGTGNIEQHTIPGYDCFSGGDDGGSYTKWYKKPVASGRMLNFKSIHPMNQKISMAYGLIDRVFRLSAPTFLEESKHTVIEMLKQNDYPLKLIHRLVKRYNEKISASLASPQTDVLIMNRFSMPFVPAVSQP